MPLLPSSAPPRKWLRRISIGAAATTGALALAVVSSTGCLSAFGARPDPARLGKLSTKSKFKDGRFENTVSRENDKPGLKILAEFLFTKAERTPPGDLPLDDPRALWKTAPESGLRATWLGHSTLLIEIDGYRVLTDPMWSERASPSTIIGPQRFHPPPVKLDELPKLDAVILSHDHYDHLDMATIAELAKGDVPFFVPLGLRDHLEKWGVPKDRITELDWWGEVNPKGTNLTLVATPSRHFSGRGLSDRNGTLWASWVIRTAQHRVYFSGDTGLTPQFEEIGEKEGPFDLVMLEVGAYHPSWGDIHLGPDNAVEALRMLGGGPLLPIHWGTFNLALHAWNDPAERLVELAKTKSFPLLTPRLGAPIEVKPSPDTRAWWREVKHTKESTLVRSPAF